AEDGAAGIDRAVAGLLVEEVASVQAAAQGHEVALTVALEPGGVAGAYAGDVIGGDEPEEFGRFGAGLAHNSDDVPGGWKANNLGTTMTAMVAFESNAVFSHNRSSLA